MQREGTGKRRMQPTLTNAFWLQGGYTGAEKQKANPEGLA